MLYQQQDHAHLSYITCILNSIWKAAMETNLGKEKPSRNSLKHRPRRKDLTRKKMSTSRAELGLVQNHGTPETPTLLQSEIEYNRPIYWYCNLPQNIYKSTILMKFILVEWVEITSNSADKYTSLNVSVDEYSGHNLRTQ